MDAPQLELFSLKSQPIPSGRMVWVVETNLGPFGNRTDVMVVDEGSVRGVSLLECSDPEVLYFNNQSASPSGDSL